MMKVLIQICYFSFLFLLVTVKAIGQELPPIIHHSPEDYNAGNQNWQISQSENNFIYAANNMGLLEFNGSDWHLYESPNESILRSVKVVGDRIYTGCYMDFGYWSRDSFGTLNYVSLIPQLDQKLQDDELIWHILELNEWVIFQASHNIYFYNTKDNTFKIINSDDLIFNIFKIDGDIYYNVRNKGVFKIENGKPKLIIDDASIKSKRVISMFSTKEGMLLLTQDSGFFKFKQDKVVKWNVEANNVLDKTNNYCGLQLSNGDFVIGTISNGIIYLNADGSINYQINQKNGLSNNTVLALFQDNDSNLWIGLDNGINCINITSPIKVLNDFEGILGMVYTSIVFNGNLYLGTNQGLFFKKANKKESFKFIEGTAGQVWNLYNYNDKELLCGHHLGTFIIDDDRASQIDTTLGTWAFKKIPNHDNLLLKGNYTGLYVLERDSGAWKVRNKISGFNSSSRFFELDKNNHIWVSHENKGVIKLTLNDNFTTATEVSLEPSLDLGKNSSLLKYRGDILYSYEKGIYKYNETNRSFEYDSLLSPIINKEDYISGKLVVDKKNRLWAFPKENINYVAIDNLTNKPKINSIAIPVNFRKVTSSFENISLIKDDIYLLGTKNGYLTIDLSEIKNDNEYHIFLNSVTMQPLNGIQSFQDIKSYGQYHYKPGIITFNFSVPTFSKYIQTEYQYKLEGQSNEWSKFTNEAYARFENLSFGDYVFKARAKVGNKLSDNIVTYEFTVDRPWFLSNPFLILYLFIILLTAYMTHRAYIRHYNKKLKNKQSESEKIIIQIKNEQLNQAIESKNRELTISKMNIIKKNELLNGIKRELNNHHHPKNISTVVKLIDDNLNNTKDWETFVNAFNSTDKGFLNKIKQLHPNLTNNDLRFCVYLRMNLSSKEIANLLNISFKSVETKRYRLRKRMNLEHEENLMDYILSL